MLIDTNIVSELMRREPDENVLRWAGRQSGFFLSVIAYEELGYGLRRRNLPVKRLWLEQFIESQCRLLPVTPAIAKNAGVMRGAFSANGVARHPSDMLIAATAAAHQMPLATRNIADFIDCGIVLVNPFEP